MLPPRAYPTSESVALKNRGLYTVKSGDSLWRIARQFGLGSAQLAALNGLSPESSLRIGQQLKIRAGDGRQLALANPGVSKRKIDYQVKRGDSLSRIAGRFSVG